MVPDSLPNDGCGPNDDAADATRVNSQGKGKGKGKLKGKARGKMRSRAKPLSRKLERHVTEIFQQLEGCGTTEESTRRAAADKKLQEMIFHAWKDAIKDCSASDEKDDVAQLLTELATEREALARAEAACEHERQRFSDLEKSLEDSRKHAAETTRLLEDAEKDAAAWREYKQQQQIEHEAKEQLRRAETADNVNTALREVERDMQAAMSELQNELDIKKIENTKLLDDRAELEAARRAAEREAQLARNEALSWQERILELERKLDTGDSDMVPTSREDIEVLRDQTASWQEDAEELDSKLADADASAKVIAHQLKEQCVQHAHDARHWRKQAAELRSSLAATAAAVNGGAIIDSDLAAQLAATAKNALQLRLTKEALAKAEAEHIPFENQEHMRPKTYHALGEKLLEAEAFRFQAESVADLAPCEETPRIERLSHQGGEESDGEKTGADSDYGLSDWQLRCRKGSSGGQSCEA